MVSFVNSFMKGFPRMGAERLWGEAMSSVAEAFVRSWGCHSGEILQGVMDPEEVNPFSAHYCLSASTMATFVRVYSLVVSVPLSYTLGMKPSCIG